MDNQLLTIGLFVATQLIVLAGVIQSNKTETKVVQREMTMINKTLETFKNVLIDIARQDERVKSIDDRLMAQGRRIDETIRRLNGFVDAGVMNVLTNNPTSDPAT